MIFRKSVVPAVFLLIGLYLSPVAHADSWMPPKPSVTYESAAKDARLTVTVTGKTDVLRGCRGTMSVNFSSAAPDKWISLWDKPLQNQHSPVTALVANGGWRVVTFDNYYSVGFGDEVIVFYDETGETIKKYSLEALLSPDELNRVPRSVSSRWWRSKAGLDEALGLLKIEVAQSKNNKATIKLLSFSLHDGELLTP